MPPVRDDEQFITLIRVAMGDPEIRCKLFSVLSLKEATRKQALHTFLDEMRVKQGDPAFIGAIAHLLDRGITDKTVDLLRKEMGSDPALTETAGEQLAYAAKLFIAIPAMVMLFFYVGIVVCGLLLFVAGIGGGRSAYGLLSIMGVVCACLAAHWVARRRWLFLAAIIALDLLIYAILQWTRRW